MCWKKERGETGSLLLEIAVRVIEANHKSLLLSSNAVLTERWACPQCSPVQELSHSVTEDLCSRASNLLFKKRKKLDLWACVVCSRDLGMLMGSHTQCVTGTCSSVTSQVQENCVALVFKAVTDVCV